MKGILILIAFLTCATATVSAQWTQQQSGVGTTLGGVWFTSPSNGWAIGQGAVILRTTNGGTSWNRATSPTYQNLYKVSFVDSLNGWITCENNVILSTTNGGNLWQAGNDGSPYGGTNYGIFCGKYNGQTSCWIAGGWMSSATSVIQKLNSYGQWSPQIMGFAGRLVRIFFLNDSLGWATGDNSLILSTTNGGLWWNEQPSPHKLNLNDIAFFDSQVGLCAGDSGLIMKSTDGGSHWKAKSHLGGILFRISLVKDSIAYVVGSAGEVGGDALILKSTDRGETWTTQNTNAPLEAHLEDIYFISGSVGWAVGANGLILHTTNGGMGSVLSTPTLSAPTAGDTLAAKDSALVWFNVSGAASYEVQIASDSLFSSVIVDSAKIADTTLALQEIIGSKLTGKTKYFWHVKAVSDTATSSFSITWSFITPTLTSMKSDKDPVPKAFELGQNYPNPFNPTTVINYGLPKNSFVKLAIYDELGRELKVLVSNEERAGIHSVNFDASSLPSGVYFYRIEAGTYKQTKKLVLLK